MDTRHARQALEEIALEVGARPGSGTLTAMQLKARIDKGMQIINLAHQFRTIQLEEENQALRDKLEALQKKSGTLRVDSP